MEIKGMIGAERFKKMESIVQQRTHHMSIILENLYDPHNISAILRTIEAYGISTAHIIEDKNPFKVSESVSMGADRWLNLKQYTSTVECIHTLKSQGYRIYTADPHPKNPTIDEISIDKPFVILMGQEKFGVSKEASALADTCFRIPLYGFVESFNVSVACAIIIAQFMYKLRFAPPTGFFLKEEEKQAILDSWSVKNNFKGELKGLLHKKLEETSF